jgi:hypothetical protein
MSSTASLFLKTTNLAVARTDTAHLAVSHDPDAARPPAPDVDRQSVIASCQGAADLAVPMPKRLSL